MTLQRCELRIARNGFPDGRDKRPRTASKRLYVSAKTVPRRSQPRKSPQIRSLCAGFRDFWDRLDCVVADAVAVEPVSAPEFPANREKNREFSVLWRKRHKR